MRVVQIDLVHPEKGTKTFISDDNLDVWIDTIKRCMAEGYRCYVKLCTL